jgi:hypothetical protein
MNNLMILFEKRENIKIKSKFPKTQTKRNIIIDQTNDEPAIS